jgi:hypothetical protein
MSLGQRGSTFALPVIFQLRTPKLNKNGCDAVIKIAEKIPAIEDYMRLRAVTGT